MFELIIVTGKNTCFKFPQNLKFPTVSWRTKKVKCQNEFYNYMEILITIHIKKERTECREM